MNNSTEPTELWTNAPFYVLSGTLGAFISLANLLIVFSIVRYEALRKSKEHVLMMALSMADALNMTAYFLTGIYRMSLLMKGTHAATITVGECLSAPHILFINYGVTLSSMMLLGLSVYRLLCVLFPLTYLGWTDSYASRLVAFIYGVKLIDTLYFYFNTNDSTETVSAICSMLDLLSVVSAVYTVVTSLAIAFFPLLSVLIYLIVIFMHVKRTKNSVQPEHPHQVYELRRQQRVTVTLWVGALCTLFLFVVPFLISIVLRTQGYYRTSLLFTCGSNLNSLASVFIYPLRHHEIRLALRSLFKCKHMPADLKMWKDDKADQKEQMQMHQQHHQETAQHQEQIEIASV